MEERNGKLRAVMLPWLAMGHLLPSFELSKRLAMKGVHISIFTTPGIIRRLPPVPPHLTLLLEFVSFPLPTIKNLPSHIETTSDLSSDVERQLLNQAYNQLEHGLTAFLADPVRPKPDWIIYDLISSNWVALLAARFGISCARFCTFNASLLAFHGPFPSYDSPEELTKVPDHIPFPTTIAYRPFEARQLIAVFPNKSSSSKLKFTLPGDLLLVKTCREFEAKWLDLIADLFSRFQPVIPVGVLPPCVDGDEEINNSWVRIRKWLDEREERSVVFVSFGTEAKLTTGQIKEIAVGLEQSRLPFLWLLRGGSPPEGFEERNAGRGLVLGGWVPQARLMAHPAIGGSLNHGGWSSVVEGLAFGVAMSVLPMVFDQGLNARNYVESGYAIEVPRNDEDGTFSGEDVARTLRMLMVEEEGKAVRAMARKAKEFFGSEKVQAEYDEELVKHLWENRKKGTDALI